MSMILLITGVVAFVDVRCSDGSNRSAGIREKLTALGATVAIKFTKEVTHVVFRDGLKSTFQQCKKRGLFLVSVMWVEQCHKMGCKLAEVDYPSVSLEKYNDPLFLARFKVAFLYLLIHIQ